MAKAIARLATACGDHRSHTPVFQNQHEEMAVHFRLINLQIRDTDGTNGELKKVMGPGRISQFNEAQLEMLKPSAGEEWVKFEGRLAFDQFMLAQYVAEGFAWVSVARLMFDQGQRFVELRDK